MAVAHTVYAEALLGHEEEEVPHELLRVADEGGERLALDPRLDLRVAQERAQLGRLLNGRREVGELLAHLGEAALLAGGREQGLGVDGVRDGQFRRVPSSRSRAA